MTTLISNIDQIKAKHDVTDNQARLILITKYTTINPEEEDVAEAMSSFTKEVCGWSKTKIDGFIKIIDRLATWLEKNS